ncbi:putative LRR receptor-like serine/threonine-protein kinase isoform X2 [Gossypium australe]|uniref:non-specific serine/threonine protein kinase n=1 Tax=Gossypium australe TaxID=47621 RepID=A0A5B6WCJ0_9ROSI|nr:putative LRR receptor-like serine/threonine-protein kinase isoform X2 [Gossypium australe]
MLAIISTMQCILMKVPNQEIVLKFLRVLPGLECLQRSFPCFRNAPRYANFSLNCGGPAIIAEGIQFEAENRTLGPAKFNVTSTQKWAVSNAGLFADRQNQLFVENNGGQVRSTNTPELYETSRLSPGSLRYYGLGLQNGPYTVRLFFAETGFPERTSGSWRSLARRVFDVYIQLFCSPDFIPTVSGIPPSNPKEKNHTALIAGVTVPVVALALILIFAIIYVKRKKEDDDEEVLLGISPRPNTFTYSELKAATEDFSPSNKLGEGGFGPVYKGTLSDGRVVAVKQLSVASNQGKDQFVAEIATISAVQHRNLVKLLGCCIGGNRRLLVYEYLVNKSLDQALWGMRTIYCNNLCFPLFFD